MTKTDRILGYLPSTFKAQNGTSPLKTVVGTFGQELQGAENALAAVMRAHWVDHADRAAPEIDDLARLAALYGLAPRDDDGVEEFRERLKRYVRTFLEGTTTVQGLLRITADALGVRIADAHEEIDAWWDRGDEPIVSFSISGADAASALFGSATATRRGKAATTARLAGTVLLDGALDLSSDHLLTLSIDGGAANLIDLSQGAGDPAAVDPDHVVARINDEAGSEVATLEADRLVITSPTSGAGGTLSLHDSPGDAAENILGLPPRVYRGGDASAASFTSPFDLSATVDLSENHYIRLLVDAVRLAEIDVAGAIPSATTLGEIVAAINAALGVAVASDDGAFLTLRSTTLGLASSLQFLAPAAQDATALLFGVAPTVVVGSDSAPGQFTGTADLSAGVDLSAQFNLSIGIDGAAPVTVNCAGADPALSELPEIVAAINAGLGDDVARHNGRSLILASPTLGPASVIVIAEAATADASEILLGLSSRQAFGQDATRAQLVGSVDLSGPTNLQALRYLRAAIDARASALIDLRSHAADLADVSTAELIESIDAVLGTGVASEQDDALVLTSPTSGSASRVAVEAVESGEARHFVSRAYLIEEAAAAVFGFIKADAQGQDASPARIEGHKDLSRGVDLRVARFLRLAVDGSAPQDIDCAGPRPRATTIEEVTARINAAFADSAIHDGKHLTLLSPTQGVGSTLVFSPPRATDAATTLLGVDETTVRGTDAVRVSFTGTTDLSAGLDLSAADRLKLAFDGAAAVEIACAGPDPANTTLAQIAIAINVALGINVASHDGRHLLLTSPVAGVAGSLEILPPGGPDATEAILGISAPRGYFGAPATAARLSGSPDLSAGADLGVAHFLRLGIDAGPITDIDVAAQAEDPTAAPLDKIIAAINEALGATIAADLGGRLVLTSPSSGVSSKVVLEATLAGDARDLLFGFVSDKAEGQDPLPATIEGNVDLRQGVELDDRVQLRLAVDSDRPLDIDLAAPGVGLIFGETVVAAINDQSTALASLTETGTLAIASPLAGSQSRLSLLPSRALEVIDYPATPGGVELPLALHGDAFVTRAGGAAAGEARVTFRAPFGVAAPGLVSFRSFQQVRLLDVVLPGQAVEIGLSPAGTIAAERIHDDGTRTPVPPARVEVGPLGPRLSVPGDELEWLAGGSEGLRMLVLDNPSAADLVVLFERTQADPPRRIAVEARRAKALPEPIETGSPITGWLRGTDGVWTLEDGAGVMIAQLEAVNGARAAEVIDQAVAVVGPLVVTGPVPVVRAEAILTLFDVLVSARWVKGAQKVETFAGVTIGQSGHAAALSLERRILVGPERSTLVKARAQSRAEAFAVPQGRTQWRTLACLASRFDHDSFDHARFAGGPCREDGLFNVSRFATAPAGPISPVFAAAEPKTAKEFAPDVALAWANHQAGHVAINLPLDLPPAFGARFNEGRFAQDGDSPESFEGVVTEPLSDPDFLVTRVIDATDGSKLVSAERVDFVPIGFAPVTMPFGKPVTLGGGTASQQAQLFLAEEGLVGFVRIHALEPGSYGNAIAVVACDTTPGRFDLLISFAGARFENARQAVLGAPLTGVTEDMLKPGPIGVLQAKAAGVRIEVTRNGIPEDC